MNIMDSDVFRDYFKLYKLSGNTETKNILIENNLGILDLYMNYDYSNALLSKLAIKGFIKAFDAYELDKSCGFVKFAIVYIENYLKNTGIIIDDEANYWYNICINRKKDDKKYNHHLT